MMNKMIFAAVLMLVPLFYQQGSASDSGIPARLEAGGAPLALNGQGTRTKLFLTLYKAGLYLTAQNSNAADIVAADRPMAIRLQIVSSFISSTKMEKATLEGFDKATKGHTEAIAKEIQQFVAVFRQEEIKEDDIYDLLYAPSTGVTVLKNSVQAAVIKGLPFKQALFGIWLSDDPVQSSLKKELLGL